SGEIAQLADLAKDHPRALNADLLRIGHRLRDIDDPETGLTIRDLLDFVEFAHEQMAIYRVMNPDYEWTITNQLLAFQIDFHQQKAWVEGGKKGPKPKPIPRPGVSEGTEKRYTTSKKSTREEVDEWLAKKRRTS